MLTVVTPATSRRLTTVEHVRADLGLGAANPSGDVLTRMIDQASQAIVTFCRREFARETVREVFRRPGSADILLERDPVISITSAAADGGLLDPLAYEIERGELYRLQGDRRIGWRFRSLTIEYVAGYKLPGEEGTDLPADVELAAIRLVGAALSTQGRDPLIKSEDVDGVSAITYWVPGSQSTLASPEAELLLKPYRRMLIG
ncbi:hypothetical protein [Hansschlegelia plantiphila]|uniref:Phage gp6-like head-tail connector protein n=1 Tax=Hansschlegelia plantiphila TaxID=374655 RepID=A0A9W6IYF7_9HYPH|nr:hypothetical protein [Hansschlegelia plantiphila]GLK67012.1 hypothetical protein GCM10008179_06500 [Hansschlegelia plantiphila]